jgi:hypothetical protein
MLALGIPQLRRTSSLVAVVPGALYALFILAPYLPAARAFALLALTFATALVGHAFLGRGGRSMLGTSHPPTDSPASAHLRLVALVAGALGFAAVTALVVDTGDTWDAVTRTADDPRVATVASGALLAVFVGGALVAALLAPFTQALALKQTETQQLAYAGTYIGWCERAVLFALLVAGEPQAAGLALAAKSFARFPTLSQRDEGFAEYFLIGTLTSVMVALVAAIGTRAILGLPVL